MAFTYSISNHNLPPNKSSTSQHREQHSQYQYDLIMIIKLLKENSFKVINISILFHEVNKTQNINQCNLRKRSFSQEKSFQHEPFYYNYSSFSKTSQIKTYSLFLGGLLLFSTLARILSKTIRITELHVGLGLPHCSLNQVVTSLYFYERHLFVPQLHDMAMQNFHLNLFIGKSLINA